MSAYPSTTTSIDGATASPATGVAKSQAAGVSKIKRTFNLDTLITGKLANADIVNLFSIPAGTVILATRIKIDVANTGAGGTSTLKLRIGTTDIGATADMLTAGTVATGGGATVSLPLSVGTAAVLVNLVAAVGSGTTTVNPTVTVSLLISDMA